MNLIDSHLGILSSAALRGDRGIELPWGLDLIVIEKMVAILAGAGLIEEVEASGTLPVWRQSTAVCPNAVPASNARASRTRTVDRLRTRPLHCTRIYRHSSLETPDSRGNF